MNLKELFEAACPFQNLYPVLALLEGRSIHIVQNRTASNRINLMQYSDLDRWFMTLLRMMHIFFSLSLLSICLLVESSIKLN